MMKKNKINRNVIKSVMLLLFIIVINNSIMSNISTSTDPVKHMDPYLYIDIEKQCQYDPGNGNNNRIVWFVDANRPGGTGRNWSQAFRYLQDALNNDQLQTGDEIWVAQGIYYPDRNATHPDGSGDKTRSFELKNKVRIYGGFEGNEEYRKDCARLFEQTILNSEYIVYC